MKDAIVAMTTVSSEREARGLAEKLVKDRVAACVQIVSKIESIYEWNGEVRDDHECLLLIKTLESRVAAIKSCFEKHHPYEVPELVVLPVIDGLKEYLQWVEGNVK